MSCCAPRQTHSAAKPGRPGITDVAALADATPPALITFAGGKSHVGTQRPAIRSDGEGLVREMKLRPFAVDAVPVTNARFAAFVAATGHVSEAERFGWGPVFRGLLSDAAAYPPSRSAMPWWITCDGA